MRHDERQKVIRAMTNEELVGEIAFGNEEALATLYHRHAGWLSGRVWAATASRELAEEVFQDTFLGVWRSAASFRADGEVGAWLWGIARRRLASAVRLTFRQDATRASFRSRIDIDNIEDLFCLASATGDRRLEHSHGHLLARHDEYRCRRRSSLVI